MNEEFVYTNDGVVASKDLEWLQLPFNMLTGLFDRVGLRTNVHKTVGMVCCSCWASGVRADKSYTWRMKGEGRSSKERQQE